MKIVVIGGTGLIGKKVVQLLKGRGHEIVAASPATGVDTMTGRGLAEVLAGASVVIDVSNSPSFEERAAMHFFETSGRNLAAAERKASVRHHVALSVVGTERLQASGYFRAKLTQEQLIEASSIPYTLIRATQFFEFIRSIADASTVWNSVRIPPVKFQPIAADDVAITVANAGMRPPIEVMIEIGGPESFSFDRAVSMVLEHDRDPRKVVADPTAPYYGVEVSEHTLVPKEGARRGSITLDQWLSSTPRARRSETASPALAH